MIKINNFLECVCGELFINGGEVFLVGGCVRDYLISKNSNDYDIEIHKLNYDKCVEIISKFGIVIVFKQFGVIKITNDNITYEFTLPRIDSKTGLKHNDFKTKIDPNLGYKRSSQRRDLTINSLMYNIKTNEILDFNNGIEDINNCLIKRVNDDFIQDPLRILRAFRFATQLGFDFEIKTLNLCLENWDLLKYLPISRKATEIEKIVKSEFFLKIKFLIEDNIYQSENYVTNYLILFNYLDVNKFIDKKKLIYFIEVVHDKFLVNEAKIYKILKYDLIYKMAFCEYCNIKFDFDKLNQVISTFNYEYMNSITSDKTQWSKLKQKLIKNKIECILGEK